MRGHMRERKKKKGARMSKVANDGVRQWSDRSGVLTPPVSFPLPFPHRLVDALSSDCSLLVSRRLWVGCYWCVYYCSP